MVGSLMTDEERVKPHVSHVALIRPMVWASLGLAIIVLFMTPTFIKQSGVGGGIFALLFWEAILLGFAYYNLKPYLTVRRWMHEGEYEQREWSPEERGLQRGNMLVFLYRATNGNSNRTVPLDDLKQFGDWTFAEVYDLLSPSMRPKSSR
jgi:hypothetical protein